MPKSTNHREKILFTALELFARHGFTGTSVRMIADDAKVSKSLLYNFFECKEDLLKDLLTMAFDDIKKSMAAYHIDADPRAALEQHIRTTCGIIKEKSDFWRMLHAIRLHEGVAGIMMAAYREIVSEVTSIFEQVFKKLNYDQPKLEALLFLSQIDGMVIMYLQDPRTPIDKLAAQLIKRYSK